MNALPIILVAHAALFVWLMLWTLYPPLSWGWVACICLMLAYWAHAAAALRASSSSRFARQSPETSDA